MTQPWEPMLLELEGRRRGRLLSFATILAGADVAEDLVQDAVIATFSRHRGFTSVEQAESYVRRAIASRFVDLTRSRSSRTERERATAARESLPDPTDAVSHYADLMSALKALPAQQRACVALRYLEDLSVRDTAAALKISEGAVKRYVSDALNHLNTLLGTDASVTDPNGLPVTTHGRSHS